jgi:hypothetical protein
MKCVDYYHSNYECEKRQLCYAGCFWFNGEQCIRQLLTEEDVEEVLRNKFEKEKDNRPVTPIE